MATRRTKPLARHEKAPITKAARELAEELNGKQLEEIKRLKAELMAERRRNAAIVKQRSNRRKGNGREAEAGTNGSRQIKRRTDRRGAPEKVLCKGLNLMGKPCQRAPLLPERWEGPEKITGLYCLDHEPTISIDRRLSFQLTGKADNRLYRRVTPGELAHEIIQRSPRYFFKPYLKSLGLDLTEDGEIVEKGMGLRLFGYSRGGEVVRSPYPDLVGQVNIAEKLLDRVYGKARQAVDLASMNTTVVVNVEMTPDRVTHVADVLAQAGALGQNGHDVIEGEAQDLLDEEPSE